MENALVFYNQRYNVLWASKEIYLLFYYLCLIVHFIRTSTQIEIQNKSIFIQQLVQIIFLNNHLLLFDFNPCIFLTTFAIMTILGNQCHKNLKAISKIY